MSAAIALSGGHDLAQAITFHQFRNAVRLTPGNSERRQRPRRDKVGLVRERNEASTSNGCDELLGSSHVA